MEGDLRGELSEARYKRRKGRRREVGISEGVGDKGN